MTLGEKILELRRKNGVSQDVLAERLDVSRQAVSKWERDEAVPETEKIVKLAQVLGVTTDYLLLDKAPEPGPRQAPQQAPPQMSFFERRIVPQIRRHGYKTGFVPIVFGTFLCIIALLVMCLLPNFGSGMFDSVDGGNNWQGGIVIEGDGDLPPEVLGDIFQQPGSFGSFEDQFQQDVDQMHSAWQGSVRTMAMLFGLPVMIFGLGMIAVGLFIVIKGKKYAAETA